MKKQTPATTRQAKPVPPSPKFAGTWRITEMSNFEEDFLEEGDEPAQIILKSDQHGIRGSYSFSYTLGHIEGQVFQFGDQAILIFCAEGSDEGDEVNTAGWLKLTSTNQLEGEFINDYSSFTAKRQK